MFIASYRLFLLTFAFTICVSSVLLAAENDKPSLDTLIDQIDEIVGGGLAPESFEAKCSDDAKACNDEELCVRAINTINPRYKDEVKRRGMRCGISDVVSTCTVSDPSGCSEAFICQRATYDIDGQKNWSLSTRYVDHAKRRGIDCGVLTCTVSDPSGCSEAFICKRATYEVNGAKNWSLSTRYVNEAKKRDLDCGVIDREQLSDIARWPDWKICSHAVFKDKWETRQKYEPYVAEAKQRGLSCGVVEAVRPVSSNKEKFAKWSDYSVCWYVTNKGTQEHKDEAKRRGIDCGVSSNKSAGSNNFENYFKNLSFAKRTQIQFSLQDLGYYKATVDGLWGQRTAKAILDFRKANNLTNGTNSYVVQTINRQAENRSSSNASSSKKFANWSDYSVCWYVTNKGTKIHKDEADRRGLNCYTSGGMSKATSSLTDKTVYKCKFNPNLTNDWAPATLEFNTKTQKAKMWNKSSQASKANNVQRYTWYRNLQDTKGETFRVTYVLTLKNALTLNGFANSVDSELLIRVSSRQVEKSPGSCELIR